MAENILGLLLVVSSSRGRAVFRYPPDPASPNIRLAQPIYSAATYTAADLEMDYTTVKTRNNKDRLKRRLFNEDGKTNSSARRSAQGSSNRRQKQLAASIYNGYEAEPSRSSAYDQDSDEGYSEASGSGSGSGSGSSSDADSDYDVIWNGQGGQSAEDPRFANHAGTSTSNSQSNNNSNHNSGPLRSVDNSVVLDASRRGSASTTTATVTEHHQTDPNVEANLKKERDKELDSQYNYALGYHLDFLSDMLSPPRLACNRKFEINVGSVVFIGHPVCSGPDGKWEIPSEEDDLPPARGRRGRDMASATLSSLSPLVEHKEGHSPSTSTSNSTDKDETPSLNMFHLVLIIDKPDPKPGTEAHDEHHNQTLGMYDEVYREIAFKWTAAAWKLQCESNFVAKQVWAMAKYKEKCLNEGIEITDCCRYLYANIPLDRNLNMLYLRLHQLKNRPANPLHSYLPTTITTHLTDMTIHMVLSPRSVDADEAWAHWGERDDVSDSDSSDSDDDDWDDPTAAIKRPELRIEPWQTLLLVDDDALHRADEISQAIIGLGIGMEEQTLIPGDRRGSKATTIATTQAEEDETALMKALIEACDVTKPLAEIAHLLRFDLEAVVIPLARELVENKKAILVDVINTKLRTVVMPTTVDEHTTSIEQYAARFTRQFPQLPPFATFISSISASPAFYRNILPADPDQATRREYMAALIWLLKQDLVVQAHTRARVFARKEVKVEAWKRLWRRRREKWLHGQKDGIKSPPSDSDLITPRASENFINPLDVTVSPPNPNKGMASPTEYLAFDPSTEMDSDEDNAGMAGAGESGFQMTFSLDVEEPMRSEIPKFESSFIFKPSRAQKDEARWLRVIREAADEVTASKFDLVVSYFDGTTTFEEISYRTSLNRKELDKIINLYKEDIITFIHP
ncbi:hypothetical protein IAT40_000137 [Kwoniella sp. CBS 6097]